MTKLGSKFQAVHLQHIEMKIVGMVIVVIVVMMVIAGDRVAADGTHSRTHTHYCTHTHTHVTFK